MSKTPSPVLETQGRSSTVQMGSHRSFAPVFTLLSRPVIALAMGLLFFGVITPIGISRRAMGKDPMRLRRGDDASYWIVRPRPDPAAPFLHPRS